MNGIFEKFTPFNGKLTGEYDCREGCFLRLYEGVCENDFNAYVSILTGEGFEIKQKRSIDGNLYAALGGKLNINLLFTPCDSALRITAGENELFPDFEKTECEGETGTCFYAFENDQTLIDCGMCLLVQCPDNSFFVVDSGHYFQANDNDRIHKFMRERTPRGEKIVINGWLITHAHTDHISKLLDFLKYNTDDVIIEGFYQNLLPPHITAEDWCCEELEMAQKLFAALDNYPAPVYKLHTGQCFYIRNLTFDVMCTHEDIFPEKIEDYNDSSCVVMMEAEGSKVFIPGDAAVLSSRMLEKRFKESLKCDVVQVAHHGHTGLSADCYSLLGASLAIFPVTRIMFDGELPRHEANRRAIELADKYFITGDGTVAVPLPYDSKTVFAYPDETFEDFEKIKRIWRYVYTEERKQELYNIFLQHGGDPSKLVIPTNYRGWIEPKPPIEE